MVANLKGRIAIAAAQGLLLADNPSKLVETCQKLKHSGLLEVSPRNTSCIPSHDKLCCMFRRY